MVVKHVKLINWRNFRKVDVDLDEVTYVIGPNASGKSNFLDVFRFLRDIASVGSGGLQKAMSVRGGLAKVRCLAARQHPHIAIVIDLAENFDSHSATWRYELDIGQQTAGLHKPVVVREVVSNLAENRVVLSRPTSADVKDPERLTQTALEQIGANEGFREMANFFADALYLHLVPQLLKFGNELSLRMLPSDPFGQGFLEKLAKCPTKVRDSRLKRIEEMLKKAIHNFSDLRFNKDAVGRPHLEMKCSHWRPNGGWQTEDEFSDGTLRLIALLWTLLESNSVILLEEPELSLHAELVRQIPELIQRSRQSRKKSGGQILVSTHSPALLDSDVICGQYLTLLPKDAGEGTAVCTPTPMEMQMMANGMTPADVLFPKTAQTVGNLSSR